MPVWQNDFGGPILALMDGEWMRFLPRRDSSHIGGGIGFGAALVQGLGGNSK